MKNMKKVEKMSVILILAWIAMSIVPGLARPEPQAELDTFLWPWFPIPKLPIHPEIDQCWTSLRSIDGCVHEIFTSFFTQQIYLGPACCKAVGELSEYCVPKIFSWGPFNPFFPPLVKSYCMSVRGVKTPPPIQGGAPPQPPIPIQAQPPTGVAPSPSEGDKPNPSQGGGGVVEGPGQELGPSPIEGVAPKAEEHGVAPSPSEGGTGTSVAEGPDQELGPSPDEEGDAPTADQGDVTSPVQGGAVSSNEEDHPQA